MHSSLYFSIKYFTHRKCKGIESIADKLKNKNENNNSQVEVKNAKIKSTRTLNKNYNVS